MAIEKLKETVPSQLRTLLHEYGEVEEYKRNEYIFKQGEEGTCFYVILSGIIQKTKSNSDGKEVTIRLATTGDIIGELTLFSGDFNYLASAKTKKATSVLRIEKPNFEKGIIKDPVLLQEFLKWVNLYARRMHMKYRDLLFAGKKGGVYSTLIRLSNSYGIQKDNGILINLSITNQELASFAGISREVVNRMLTDLKSDGIISIKNKKITIHDMGYLRQEVQCENCPIEICTIF